MIAFSLIEIMVVVGLLSLIIVGLVAMFGQTQRAFRASMTQVDVLEGGRAVSDLIQRDLSQVTPAYMSPFYGISPVRNFDVLLRGLPTLKQALPGTNNLQRTNLLEDLFFLTHENQTWTGIGYYVRTNDSVGNLEFPGPSHGSLYRFATNYTDRQFKANPGVFFRDYFVAQRTVARSSKLLDGVVHFQVRPFDVTNGWITTTSTSTNIVTGFVSGPNSYLYRFYSNAVPAAVELEVGVLEIRAVERANALPVNVRSNYLSQQAARTHIFRLRVPIRNVDPAVYQ